MIAGITCRMYSGCSAQSFHLQAGIIGKTVITVVLLYVTGFLQGVVLKGITGFGDILVAVYVIQGKHLETVAEYLTNLLQFVSVIGGKDQFHTA